MRGFLRSRNTDGSGTCPVDLEALAADILLYDSMKGDFPHEPGSIPYRLALRRQVQALKGPVSPSFDLSNIGEDLERGWYPDRDLALSIRGRLYRLLRYYEVNP